MKLHADSVIGPNRYTITDQINSTYSNSGRECFRAWDSILERDVRIILGPPEDKTLLSQARAVAKMGDHRNVLVVQTADVVIALPGEYGTLSEIAYCLQFKKPVLNLSNWDISGTIKVNTVDEAIKELKNIISK